MSQGEQLRIAISQRYDQVPGRDEWRDSLDAEWTALLERIGFLPIILPNKLNDVGGYLDALRIDGVILSGGNDIGSAPQRDKLEERVLAYAEIHSLPVMGVCRGMQFLCLAEGGNLHDCSGHVAKEHQLEGVWAHRLGIQTVNSYHNQAILQVDCPDCFDVLATTKDGVVEAFRHKNKNWLGVMWHPEREVSFKASDLKLIQTYFQK